MKKELGAIVLGLFLAAGGFGEEHKITRPPRVLGPKDAFISINLAIKRNDLRGIFDNYYIEGDHPGVKVSPEEAYKQTVEYFENDDEKIGEQTKQYFSELGVDFSNSVDLSSRTVARRLTQKLAVIFYDEKVRGWAMKTENGWKIHRGVRGEMDFEYMNWSLDQLVDKLDKYKIENGAYPENLVEIDDDKLENLFSQFGLTNLTADYFNGGRRIYPQYKRGDYCYSESEHEFILWSVGPDTIDENGKVIFDPETGKGDLVRYSSEEFFETYSTTCD